MKRKLLTFFMLFFILQSLSAQMNEYFNDIKATYKVEKQKELVSIAENLKNAELKDADAQQKFTSGDVNKGIGECKKLASIYTKNYRDLFLMYEDKIKIISKDVEGNKADYVTYLINEAKNSFRISIANRLEALKEDKAELAFELLNSSHKNEREAIDFQSRAFGVINGWIKEDFKIEKPDYSDNVVYDNETTDNFKVRDFTENEIPLPENYDFNKTIVNNNSADTEVSDSNTSSDNSDFENSYSDNTNNSTYENSNSTTGTEFRIQIGVSILPATESQIKRLNSTDLEVKTYKSKVYYKYTIGQFASYQDAKYYKNAYGLAKTYITEYKNGKEVKFYFKDI